MPARANITINDGQATPVAHTFNPTYDKDADIFEDRSGGIAIGFPLVTCRFRRPISAGNGTGSDANKRVYRIQLNLNQPVLEVTSASTGTGIQPAPTVAYVLRTNTEWVFPERSTLQNRKDQVALFANLLANNDVKKVLQDLESFW